MQKLINKTFKQCQKEILMKILNMESSHLSIIIEEVKDQIDLQLFIIKKKHKLLKYNKDMRLSMKKRNLKRKLLSYQTRLRKKTISIQMENYKHKN